MQNFDSRERDRRGFKADDWRRTDDRRGPHRGRGPTGRSRSDADIAADLHEALAHDRYLDASDVDVVVKNGDIALSGSVPEADDRLRAEIHAQKVRGSRQIRNELRVASREGLGPTLGMDVRDS